MRTLFIFLVVPFVARGLGENLALLSLSSQRKPYGFHHVENHGWFPSPIAPPNQRLHPISKPPLLTTRNLRSRGRCQSIAGRWAPRRLDRRGNRAENPSILPSAPAARPSERKGPGRAVASPRHASPRPGRGPQGRPPARPRGEGFASPLHPPDMQGTCERGAPADTGPKRARPSLGPDKRGAREAGGVNWSECSEDRGPQGRVGPHSDGSKRSSARSFM
jgi:hypothetical protein